MALFLPLSTLNFDFQIAFKGLYDLPDRMGKIKQNDLENLDAQFFKLHQKQAECMDPQLRMLLESTYEAIIDAGINPQEIKGSKTGVYVGVSNSETEQFWCKDPEMVNGYGLTGCARAMFANRISFTFDFKGPSYAVDTGNYRFKVTFFKLAEIFFFFSLLKLIVCYGSSVQGYKNGKM